MSIKIKISKRFEMNRVFGKGLNIMKQLGNSESSLLDKYHSIPELEGRKVKWMHAGTFQSYFCLEDGQIVYMGYSVPHQATPRVFRYYKAFPRLFEKWQSLTKQTIRRSWSLTDYTDQPTLLNPKAISNNHEILQFKAADHSLFYIHNGSAFAMGNNSYGQLGTGTKGFHFQFEEVKLPIQQPIVDISSGDTRTLFTTSYGDVYRSGRAPIEAWTQQQGVNLEKVNQPVLVTNKHHITKTAVGTSHQLFLTNDNRLFGLGDNSYGQCGNGDKVVGQLTQIPCFFSKYQQIQDIKAGSNHNLIMTDKRVYFLGRANNNQYPFRIQTPQADISSPVIVPIGGKPLKIFANFDRSAILTSDNQVLIFGGSKFQKGEVQTVQNSNISPGTQVALGYGHTLISV